WGRTGVLLDADGPGGGAGRGPAEQPLAVPGVAGAATRAGRPPVRTWLAAQADQRVPVPRRRVFQSAQAAVQLRTDGTAHLLLRPHARAGRIRGRPVFRAAGRVGRCPEVRDR